jgi:cell division protein FtsB
MRARRAIVYGLAALLVLLQWPLWFGNGGAWTVWRLSRQIAAQQEENARLRERNRVLAAEVIDLKSGLAAVEERARAELGMIKRGETFFHVIDQPYEGAPYVPPRSGRPD